jgi:hypothetical protein
VCYFDARPLLDQRLIVVREAGHQGLRQVLCRIHPAHAERAAARARFDEQLRTQPFHDPGRQRGCAHVVERLLRQRHRLRCLQPGLFQDRLGGGRVERRTACVGAGADVGHPGQLQDLLYGPVLPGDAVQHGEDHARRVLCQCGQQVLADVAEFHFDPGPAQRVGHPRPGAQ